MTTSRTTSRIRAAVGFGGDLGDGDDDRLLGRRLEQPLELGDRPLGHDPGRRQPRCDPLAEELPVGGHVTPVGVQAGHEPLEPLGRVGGLERDELVGSSVCGPPIWSTTRSRSIRWSSWTRPRSQTTRIMSRVIRSSSGWTAASIASASAQGRLHQAGGGGPDPRARDRPGDRRSARRRTSWRSSDLAQDRLPEAVGEDVDRRGRVELGHRGPPVARRSSWPGTAVGANRRQRSRVARSAAEQR